MGSIWDKLLELHVGLTNLRCKRASQFIFRENAYNFIGITSLNFFEIYCWKQYHESDWLIIKTAIFETQLLKHRPLAICQLLDSSPATTILIYLILSLLRLMILRLGHYPFASHLHPSAGIWLFSETIYDNVSIATLAAAIELVLWICSLCFLFSYRLHPSILT